MAEKQKFYVVWKGFQPGIYETWDECKKQVEGYADAKYKAFPTLESAQDAFINKNFFFKAVAEVSKKAPVIGICVDAAFSSKTKAMEYRAVLLPEKKEIFLQGPYYDATNNIGEFLAIVHALALCFQKKRNDDIYSDSQTAIAWVRNKKTKTNLELTERNKYLFELIDRAEKWLQEHTYSNKVLKWQTEIWGEIPADFGRK